MGEIHSAKQAQNLRLLIRANEYSCPALKTPILFATLEVIV